MRHLRDRAAEQDDVKRPTFDAAFALGGAIGDAYFHIAHACIPQPVVCAVGEFRHQLQRQHMVRAVAQQRRHIAGTGADFQHGVSRLYLQILQEPGL